MVNEQKVDLEIVTFVLVSFIPHDRKTTEDLLKKIRKFHNVTECDNIFGVHDYLLKTVAPSISECLNFIIDGLIEVPAVGKV